jgi:predicted DNA-binding helix-hairpin-helix protein
MFYNNIMDAFKKLQLQGQLAAYEDDGLPPPQPPACPKVDKTAAMEHHIYQAAGRAGQRVPILKTLLTSVCERNCYYCACRAGRDFKRITFQPEEMADAVMRMHQAGSIQGAFLSSGVAGGGLRTQDRILATAEILRRKLGYRGYIHLKIMPGAEQAQVEQAMLLADRVSINLEAPNSSRLKRLAPMKTLTAELLQPLRWVDQIRQDQSPHMAWKGRWPSSTTQFVVGGSGETDLELLQATQYLTSTLKLARTYFSGFTPVANTPLDHLPPVDPWRRYRLYQASFLLRDYPFNYEELPFDPSGNLPLDTDPKMAWAKNHLFETPLDINHADMLELLRVPGIGPINAKKIITARQRGRLFSIEDLKALGIQTRRAEPFILINGRRQPVQLSLW